ncbi:MAG: family 20 glycosylhydrolase [Bacteroidales bacterium]|nr:family 20 glycosylhydrolase [Bacteroidales bacterium]
MKNIFIYLITAISAILMLQSCGEKTTKPYNQGINIIPAPMEIKADTSKRFELKPSTVFVVESDSVKIILPQFAERIRNAAGYDLAVVEKYQSNSISLAIDPSLPLKNEGYTLFVDENGAKISGKTLAGVYYGLQTLMQLFPAEIESTEKVKDVDFTLPFVEITDEPRFEYRGILLDPSRHFVDAEYIKKQIDIWAMYKINTLHWHLTDDQGWRIEIKKYPELTKAGATRIDGEGTEYGVFYYTQEEAKEIVRYAAERFITVIPELEVPGHELAAISAYPWLSCTGDTVAPRIIWGVEDILMCPGKESTFEFLQNVIDELVEIFPSEYFHIGGDECPKVFWKECPLCQAKIAEENLAVEGKEPEECLQSYVVKRVEDMLAKHGRKIIGWDEILDGNVDKSATVMSWRGEEGGIIAAQKGHDVIMVPISNGMYINFYQGDSKVEPVSIGGDSRLEVTYSYNPIPDTIAKLKLEKHIRGVQCNLWAEYLYTPELRERQCYPNSLALAEIAWSQNDRKDFSDFCNRLNNAFVRLDKHDIIYHLPMPEQPNGSCNFVAFTDSAVLEFTTSHPIKMVYALNGEEINQNSTEYTAPIIIKDNTLVKIASVLPSGKLGDIREITVEKQTLAAATSVENKQAGLKMTNIAGYFLNVAEMEKAENAEKRDTIISKLIDIRSVRNFGEEKFGYKNYASIAEGYIEIEQDGVYYFSTDNEEFWIDGQKLIDNSGEVKRFSRHDKSIALAKGLHPIKIVYLGHIIGGWPSVWNDGKVEIRRADQKEFSKIDEMVYYQGNAMSIAK